MTFDNRGFGESDAPAGAVHDGAARRATRSRVLDARGDRARARARDQPRRDDRAGARARRARSACESSCSCSTTPGGPNAVPMPEQTVALMGRRRTLDPRGGDAPVRRERALARSPPRRRSSTRSSRTARRTRRTPPAGTRRRGAGAAHDAMARLGEIACRRSSSTAPPTTSSTRATRRCSPTRSRARGSSCFDGVGHLLPWERPERVRRARRGVPRVSLHTIDHWIRNTRAADAGPRRDRLPRPRGHVRRARPALGRARRRAARARPAPRRPRRDADRQLARARDRLLRLREGRLHARCR